MLACLLDLCLSRSGTGDFLPKLPDTCTACMFAAGYKLEPVAMLSTPPRCVLPTAAMHAHATGVGKQQSELRNWAVQSVQLPTQTTYLTTVCLRP